MKRSFFPIVAAVLAFAVLGCSESSQAMKNFPTNPSDNDTILNFRLERYDLVKGEPVRSAVYSIHRYKSVYSDKFTSSVYFRDYSTYAQGEGYDYSDVNVDSALVELSAAADSLHLLDFARTPLDKEDKKRSRWMVEICYSSGAKVEIVEYIDPASTTAEAPVVAVLEPIFKRLALQASQPGAFREYTRTTYKPDGKWQRRIRYDDEGRVCGGDDSDDPYLEF